MVNGNTIVISISGLQIKHVVIIKNSNLEPAASTYQLFIVDMRQVLVAIGWVGSNYNCEQL